MDPSGCQIGPIRPEALLVKAVRRHHRLSSSRSERTLRSLPGKTPSAGQLEILFDPFNPFQSGSPQ